MDEQKRTRLTFNELPFYRPEKKYKLLPFSFTKHREDRYIISNDYGEYHYLTDEEFKSLTSIHLPTDTLYYDLKAKFFLADEINDDLLNLLATKLRTKKSFLFNFTALHMFVVTLRCDHSCHYCQVSRKNTSSSSKFDMSEETADRSVDLVFKSPSPGIKIEFQGGESLLNFPLIKRIVMRALDLNQNFKKDLGFVIATNLSRITPEQLQFCKLYNIDISTSLDGPPSIHNQNRPIDTNDSYQRFTANLKQVREILGSDKVSALMTTTNLSLEHPKEIIDEYVKLDFRSIFLRSISPYGFAVKSKKTSHYETDKFLNFYREGLNYIIELNRKGIQLAESFASIILSKILTPFPTHFVDLQSPAGVGVGGVIYNYDGIVYASDESRMLAEMGDKHFALGDVHKNSHEEIFGNPVLVKAIKASIAECLPKCSDCAYRPFCGGDPINHYALQKDEIGHRPTSIFCNKNMGIIKYLLDLVEDADDELKDIFYSWIYRKSLRDIRNLSSN
jgi:uncharacterized protein